MKALRNPKDPLIPATPASGRDLFERFIREANGYPQDAVLSAAMNVVINAIRQAEPTRARAEARYDEMVGCSKQVLVDHYDVFGRKRGVFPYPQIIEVPHFFARKR